MGVEVGDGMGVREGVRVMVEVSLGVKVWLDVGVIVGVSVRLGARVLEGTGVAVELASGLAVRVGPSVAGSLPIGAHPAQPNAINKPRVRHGPASCWRRCGAWFSSG